MASRSCPRTRRSAASSSTMLPGRTTGWSKVSDLGYSAILVVRVRYIGLVSPYVPRWAGQRHPFERPPFDSVDRVGTASCDRVGTCRTMGSPKARGPLHLRLAHFHPVCPLSRSMAPNHPSRPQSPPGCCNTKTQMAFHCVLTICWGDGYLSQAIAISVAQSGMAPSSPSR